MPYPSLFWSLCGQCPLDVRALGDLSGFPALCRLYIAFCEVRLCESVVGAVGHARLKRLHFHMRILRPSAPQRFCSSFRRLSGTGEAAHSSFKAGTDSFVVPQCRQKVCRPLTSSRWPCRHVGCDGLDYRACALGACRLYRFGSFVHDNSVLQHSANFQTYVGCGRLGTTGMFLGACRCKTVHQLRGTIIMGLRGSTTYLGDVLITQIRLGVNEASDLQRLHEHASLGNPLAGAILTCDFAPYGQKLSQAEQLLIGQCDKKVQRLLQTPAVAAAGAGAAASEVPPSSAAPSCD